MLSYQSLSITEQINFTLISFLTRAIAATEVQQWAKQITPTNNEAVIAINHLQTFLDEEPENSSAYELLYDLEEMDIFFELEITQEQIMALEGVTLERNYIPPQYSRVQQANAQKCLAAHSEIKELFSHAFPFVTSTEHPYRSSSPHCLPLRNEKELLKAYEFGVNRFAFISSCYYSGAISLAEASKWAEKEIITCEDISLLEVYAELCSLHEEEDLRQILEPITNQYTLHLTSEESEALRGIALLRHGEPYEDCLARMYAAKKSLLEYPAILEFLKKIFPFIKI